MSELEEAMDKLYKRAKEIAQITDVHIPEPLDQALIAEFSDKLKIEYSDSFVNPERKDIIVFFEGKQIHVSDSESNAAHFFESLRKLLTAYRGK